MLTQKSPFRHDPARLVRLVTVRPMYFGGKALQAGTEFEIQAQHAAEVLITQRAKFADESDRHLVYKQVEHF